MEFCNCYMFCCTFLYVPSSFAIILMGKRELVALLSLSSCCLVIVAWHFLVVPWVGLQFVIVVFLIKLTYYFDALIELEQEIKTELKMETEHSLHEYSFINLTTSKPKLPEFLKDVRYSPEVWVPADKQKLFHNLNVNEQKKSTDKD